MTKTIIWDLGGVLFTPQRFKIALCELGLPSLLGYTFLDVKHPGNLQQRAFEILNLLGTQKGPDYLKVKSIKGLELPQIFVDVLTGTIEPADALHEAYDLIDLLYHEGYITSKRERKLLRNIMRTMFNTDTFAKYMQPSPLGAHLVAQCAQDPLVEQLVLSNWDSYSFTKLYASKKGQKVFKHIPPEHILISGDCGLAKPDPALYQKLIDTYQLDPKECVVIDDNKDNVQAAYRCGFNAIWFHNMSHKTLRKLLIKHGFLSAHARGGAKAPRYARV